MKLSLNGVAKVEDSYFHLDFVGFSRGWAEQDGSG
jgi:hypothetical protein